MHALNQLQCYQSTLVMLTCEDGDVTPTEFTGGGTLTSGTCDEDCRFGRPRDALVPGEEASSD